LRWLFQGKKAAESKARVTFGHFVLFSLLINSLQNRTLTDFRLGKPRQGTQTKVVLPFLSWFAHFKAILAHRLLHSPLNCHRQYYQRPLWPRHFQPAFYIVRASART
jgi:hypothetical protein